MTCARRPNRITNRTCTLRGTLRCSNRVESQTLVGRAAELATLDLLIEELQAGNGHTLLVEGTAGIGKSRLVTELSARANSVGYLVLRGSASELERDLPFGPFVDAIDDYLVGVDQRKLSRLEPDVNAELARVFPALAGSGGEEAKLLQHERYRSHRAVRALLETVATKPVVLILDDFDWADGASGELVRPLVRRPPDAPVL